MLALNERADQSFYTTARLSLKFYSLGIDTTAFLLYNFLIALKRSYVGNEYTEQAFNSWTSRQDVCQYLVVQTG